MNRALENRWIVIILVGLISVLFLAMIRAFLIAILLAGIFSALAHPLYERLARLFHGRQNLAALATLLAIFLIVFLPLTALLGIVAAQAMKISASAAPWIEQWTGQPSGLENLLSHLPFWGYLAGYKTLILQKGGEAVGKLSLLLFENLSAFTLSTLNFIFLFFVMLYTMFFFIKEGDRILQRFLHFLPLTDSVEHRLLERFTTVAKATIQGTLVIGVIQGGLAGLAFWVVGIQDAVFWGTIMTVLSIIPAIGSALVWIPAVIILLLGGHIVKAVGLLLFCSLLVGSIDNLLRPWLVGRDTELHELLIFFGTLGGISLFGIIGFIIGPIIAALFVTLWDVYAETFADFLSRGDEDSPT